MAKVNLDHNEFLDFIMVMLYDLMKNDSYLNKNERFNELKDTMIKKGLKPLLFNYYLTVDAEIRKEYKNRFKNILKNDSIKPGTLFIYPMFENLVSDISEILIGKKLNEDKINKIVDKLLK